MATLLQETEFKNELISAIGRFGKPASLMHLCSPSCTFHLPNVDGLIGYQLASNVAVAIGDPLCSVEEVPKLTKAFLEYCRKAGHSNIFLLTSEAFSHLDTFKTRIQAGEEVILDPTEFQMKQKLRWKIHQAEQHGVNIKEYTINSSLENQLKETMQEWLKKKHGPQIYLGTFGFFEEYGEKRIFFAEKKGKVLGLVTILYLPPLDGWVVTSLIALPEAPIGVTEALMNRVLTTLTEERCHFLCLGFVAAPEVGEITGLSPLSKWLIRRTYRLARNLFHLDAKRIYFNKYHPNYHPTYILASDKLGIKELLAIKKTLNVKL